MKKVLIFTEKKVGEGHYQAAIALRDAFLQQGAEAYELKIVSGLHTVSPLLERLSILTYFGLLRIYPPLWGWVYKKVKRPTILQTYYFALKLLPLIEQFRPDLVICTHPACIPALSLIKRWNKHSFLLGKVFTDFGFHPYAVQREVDFYFTANERTKQNLIQTYQIEERRIFLYGIPIRPEFEAEELFTNVRILTNKKRFQLLIMGGATGHGPLEKVVELISRSFLRCDIVVITGRNQRLYERLRKKNLPDVTVLGYVDNMRYWYQKSDLILTKPGGLTVSEVLSCCTPLLILKPIPGQEEMNHQFLTTNRLALEVQHYEQIPQLIAYWIREPKPLNEIKKRMQQWRKKDAAQQIVNRLILLQKEWDERDVLPDLTPANAWHE